MKKIIILTLIFIGLLNLNSQAKNPDLELIKICSGFKDDDAKLQEILDGGADVNFKDKKGKTALLYATEKNFTKIATKLIENKADLDEYDPKIRETALIIAAKKGNLDIVNALTKAGADVNFKNKNGETALLICSKMIITNDDIIMALIDAKADLNVATEKERQTPLMLMVQKKGKHAIIKKLIKSGADVNLRDNKGHTALVVALDENAKIYTDLFDYIEILIKIGDIDLNKSLAIHFLGSFEYSAPINFNPGDDRKYWPDIMLEFIMGMDNDVKRSDIPSTFGISFQKGNEKITDLTDPDNKKDLNVLDSEKADRKKSTIDINFQDALGKTPMMVAIQSLNPKFDTRWRDLIPYLIKLAEYGADLDNIIDKSKKTADDYLTYYKNPALYEERITPSWIIEIERKCSENYGFSKDEDKSKHIKDLENKFSSTGTKIGFELTDDFVIFTYNAEDYFMDNKKIVSLTVAGDFNGWKVDNPNWQAKDDDKDGIWTLEVEKTQVKNGSKFKFVVNKSEWQQPPTTINKKYLVDDGYGGFNLRVIY